MVASIQFIRPRHRYSKPGYQRSNRRGSTRRALEYQFLSTFIAKVDIFNVGPTQTSGFHNVQVAAVVRQYALPADERGGGTLGRGASENGRRQVL